MSWTLSHSAIGVKYPKEQPPLGEDAFEGLGHDHLDAPPETRRWCIIRTKLIQTPNDPVSRWPCEARNGKPDPITQTAINCCSEPRTSFRAAGLNVDPLLD